MHTEEQRIAEFADELFVAERDGKPVPPLSGRFPDLTVADAYAIQSVNITRRVESGHRIRGRKVGLTSRAMQEMVGVDEPDFGALLDDMFVSEDEPLRVTSLIAPRVETEIAFLLERDLVGPGLMVTDVLRATAGVIAAVEIIDSRVEDWRIQLTDTVADNASAARVVLGGRIVPVDRLDLRLLGGVFSSNGEVVATGAGAAVLGHPARCVAWLANKLGTFGQQLSAGDVVMAGAIHRAIDVGAGDVVRAEFDQLGSVTVRFTA